MTSIPQSIYQDPTLAAIDAAMEEKQKGQSARAYLGMSGVGDACSRKVWYRFRWMAPARFDASTLKKFDDGHAGEDVQAARLRMVEGVTLHTHNEDGSQFGFSDLGGHFRGHMDGAIIGLLQAPKTWHVWEHKQSAPSVYSRLSAIVAKVGEGDALKEWNGTYYGQAQLYMHYSGITRHYLTVATAGGRETQSVRTKYSKEDALALIELARELVYANEPPMRVSDSPSWWQCKFCEHIEACHGLAAVYPAVNCRTCAFSTPTECGRWRCTRDGAGLSTRDQQAGCREHLFRPDLMPGEAVEADPQRRWIRYEDGLVNCVEGAEGKTSRELTPWQ